MSIEKHARDARRRNIRYRILAVADTGRELGVDEPLVIRVLNDLEFVVSIAELRKEAAFLDGKGYLEYFEKTGIHYYKITALGVELVEGDIPCPKSINHPGDYY